MSTSRTRWQPCHETRPRYSAPTLFLRLDAARRRSASFGCVVYPRGRKVHGISSQKMSAIRETGGCIGETAALMVADPTRAHDVLEHLRGFTAPHTTHDLIDLILAEQRSDSAEDVSQTELLADMTPEKLAKYRDDLRKAIADAQRLLDAVNEELEARDT